MTTNQMIRLREKNLFDLKSKKKLETEPSLVALQNTKFYYNDLTPNRNVNGFNVYNLLSQKKLKLYCEKFTHHDRNISMSYQDKSFQFYKKTIKTSLKEEIE